MKNNIRIINIIIWGCLCISTRVIPLPRSMKKDNNNVLSRIYNGLKEWSKDNTGKAIGAVGTLVGIAALTADHIGRKEDSIASKIYTKIKDSFNIMGNEEEDSEQNTKKQIAWLKKEAELLKRNVKRVIARAKPIQKLLKIAQKKLSEHCDEFIKRIDTLNEKITILAQKNNV